MSPHLKKNTSNKLEELRYLITESRQDLLRVAHREVDNRDGTRKDTERDPKGNLYTFLS